MSCILLDPILIESEFRLLSCESTFSDEIFEI